MSDGSVLVSASCWAARAASCSNRGSNTSGKSRKTAGVVVASKSSGRTYGNRAMLATFQSDQLPTVLNPSLRSSAIAIVFQRVFQILTEHPDEVRRQVVDHWPLAGFLPVDVGERSGLFRQPRQTAFQAFVVRRRVYPHAIESRRPERMTVRIDEPPARAIVVSGEEMLAFELAFREAAPR